MKSAITILSLLLITFPTWILNMTQKKFIVFSSLSYYGSDFDGDNFEDLAAWHPQTNTLYYQLSSTGKFYKRKFFENSKLQYDPVFADYDGDGITDFSFFQPNTGHWITFKSTDPTNPEKVFFGSVGDIPIPGNYDGNNVFEKGLFRANAALWLIYNPDASGVLTPSFIVQGNYQDNPISADYDGDKKSDLTTWRLDDGSWYINKSSDNFSYDKSTSIKHGKEWDIVVPNDYNNDGKYDLVFWRPSDQTWYIKLNEYNVDSESTNSAQESLVKTIKFGEAGDIPSSIDINGDSYPELVMWNPKTKAWKMMDINSNKIHTLKWNVPDGCISATSIIHRF